MQLRDALQLSPDSLGRCCIRRTRYIAYPSSRLRDRPTWRRVRPIGAARHIDSMCIVNAGTWLIVTKGSCDLSTTRVIPAKAGIQGPHDVRLEPVGTRRAGAP